MLGIRILLEYLDYIKKKKVKNQKYNGQPTFVVMPTFSGSLVLWVCDQQSEYAIPQYNMKISMVFVW